MTRPPFRLRSGSVAAMPRPSMYSRWHACRPAEDSAVDDSQRRGRHPAGVRRRGSGARRRYRGPAGGSGLDVCHRRRRAACAVTLTLIGRVARPPLDDLWQLTGLPVSSLDPALLLALAMGGAARAAPLLKIGAREPEFEARAGDDDLAAGGAREPAREREPEAGAAGAAEARREDPLGILGRRRRGRRR